jgi:hypothetical protein
MANGTLKELTTAQMAKICYGAWWDLDFINDMVAAWEPFDNLPEPLKTLEVGQVEAIIENIRIRPHELHEKFKVTVQNMVAEGQLEENIIARLKPYMIPFVGLSVINQTKFRLQVQLTRILMRHNKNVERSKKRPR